MMVSLLDVVGKKGRLYDFGRGDVVYKGRKNPWLNHMLGNNIYEPDGLFQYLIKEETPKILSVVQRDNHIISYAMCWQGSSYMDDNYPLKNFHNLGWCGVYTAPECRGFGFANIAISNMFKILHKRLERVKLQKPPALECDYHILNTFMTRSNGICIHTNGSE